MAFQDVGNLFDPSTAESINTLLRTGDLVFRARPTDGGQIVLVLGLVGGCRSQSVPVAILDPSAAGALSDEVCYADGAEQTAHYARLAVGELLDHSEFAALGSRTGVGV